MFRYFAFAALVFSAFQCVFSGNDGQAAQEGEPSAKWIARIGASLFEVEEEHRASAMTTTAYALVRVGESERAKELMRRLLPREERTGALLGIADAQSLRDQLNESLATVDELPTDDARQAALSIVATRQAQRGDIRDAIRLLPEVKEGDHRDRLLSAIAKAQMNAGELRIARDTAKRIEDGERRRETLEQMDKARQDEAPISKVRSAFLREQLMVMLLFSGTQSQHDAIRAIAAAQEKDRSALTEHMNAALAETEGAIPLVRATTLTLLAVALVEAGDRNEAHEMIIRARKAGSDEWLGVSSLFGSPILVYLLIRLDMNEELQTLMDSLQESDTIAGPIAYRSNLMAIGGTYGELGRIGDADEYYGRLESPLERVDFAAGVLMHLRGAANQALDRSGRSGANQVEH